MSTRNILLQNKKTLRKCNKMPMTPVDKMKRQVAKMKKQMTSMRKKLTEKNNIISTLQTSMDNINEHLEDSQKKHSAAYTHLENRTFDIQEAYDKATSEISDLLDERDTTNNQLRYLHTYYTAHTNLLDENSIVTPDDLAYFHYIIYVLNQRLLISGDPTTFTTSFIDIDAKHKIKELEGLLADEQLYNDLLTEQIRYVRGQKLAAEQLGMQLLDDQIERHNATVSATPLTNSVPTSAPIAPTNDTS